MKPDGALNAEFQRGSNECATPKAQRFQKPKRNVGESIYWLRIILGKIAQYTQPANLEMGAGMILRPKQALDTFAIARLSALSAMSASANPYSVANIQNITQELLSIPLKMESIRHDEAATSRDFWIDEQVSTVKPKRQKGRGANKIRRMGAHRLMNYPNRPYTDENGKKRTSFGRRYS